MVLTILTFCYTAIRDNYWVMAAMTGVRASIVPIMASAALPLVKGAFHYPPCVAIALLSFSLYLFWNVSCVLLVILGMVGGLAICEFYERKKEEPPMVLLELLWSFTKIGFTSFGGLSMIPLITSEVLSHGWMTASEVSDIVAIAEMTPGPLGINCATFAGIQAAEFPGPLPPIWGYCLPPLPYAPSPPSFLSG